MSSAMRGSTLVTLLFTSVVLLCSCQKQPEACITTDKRSTTYFVGETVQFQSNCSQNAERYRWNIGQYNESGTFDQSGVKYTFSNSGTYEIKLTTYSGTRSSTASMFVTVVAD